VPELLAGRGVLLLPAAALVVHELRYRLAHGDDAGAVLSSEGHGYLTSLAPWTALLVAVALGAFLVRVARSAAAGADPRPRRSFLGLWALASGSLVAIYVSQELLEGLLASGHPAGLGGVFGAGGWWALVASVALGAAVAALLGVAAAVVAAASRRALPHRSGSDTAVLRPRSVVALVRRGLAAAAAGRAPPARRAAALPC
jgi:hypothetical protein